MAKTKTADCKCVEDVNAKLAESGCRVTRHMQINFATQMASLSGPCVAVERIGKSKRGKIPTVLCSYCPFCGKKFA
jgi:hypothetical protein